MAAKKRVSSACKGKSLNKPFKTPSGPKKSAVCVKDGSSVKGRPLRGQEHDHQETHPGPQEIFPGSP